MNKQPQIIIIIFLVYKIYTFDLHTLHVHVNLISILYYKTKTDNEHVKLCLIFELPILSLQSFLNRHVKLC